MFAECDPLIDTEDSVSKGTKILVPVGNYIFYLKRNIMGTKVVE